MSAIEDSAPPRWSRERHESGMDRWAVAAPRSPHRRGGEQDDPGGSERCQPRSRWPVWDSTAGAERQCDH